MSRTKSWMVTGNIAKLVDSKFSMCEDLPVGVYTIDLSMTGFSLEKLFCKFTFPYKVYGLQKEFINHVIKTYQNTTENLGILLNGHKGAGKTIVAKELCNTFNLPVIILKNMKDNNDVMIEFLASIECPCVILLDEYEKEFGKDDTILRLMDGALSSGGRKIFLLTTNELDVNTNLLGRPSRIRYLKEFGNLELEVINEYLDDALKVPEARQEVIDFIDTLKISTIDILKTVVNEVNIHGSIEFAKKFFNVEQESYLYYGKHCYVYLNRVRKENITLQQFKEYIKASEKYVKPRWVGKTPEERREFDKEVEEWRNLVPYSDKFSDVCYDNFGLDIKFSKLSPGKVVDPLGNYDDYTIIEYDKDGFFSAICDDVVRFFYISNPNSKPSIYNPENVFAY